MFFGFFRRLRRKIVLCLCIVGAVIILKQAYPGLGSRIGTWISGMESSRAVQAISSFVSTLTSGDGMREAVEVFQRVFGLPVTGVIDYRTWYKISEIYVAVARLAELV